MAGGVCGREACVTGRHVWQGGMCGREACVAGRRVWQGDGHLWQGEGIHGRRRVWHKGMHGMRGACVAGETAAAEGGKHPTGTHSCFLVTYIVDLFEF